MIWVQRGNCPHLVESTAILISAMLNDVPGNSTYCVRAAYAAAFCRYVLRECGTSEAWAWSPDDTVHISRGAEVDA